MSATPPNEKHLELIQTVINRLANNSFLLKGWSITLTAGLLGLAAKEADRRFAIVAYLPLIVFWLLDAYYLRQERLYRRLYEAARTGSAAGAIFRMDAATFSQVEPSWLATSFDPPLLLLYGCLLVVTVIAACLL
jgi:hypothetical protein